MKHLIAFLIIGICFAVFYYSQRIWTLNRGRRAGRYPDPKKATLFDVRALIKDGEIDLATQLYSEIFSVNLKESRKAVKELEQSMKSR